MCGMEAKFRARGIGCPFVWWCQDCYDVDNHKDLPHDKEFPILCHKCNQQPATCRVKSKLKPCWSYWCYTCLEKDDHDGQSHDDMVIHDLDSASESNEDESVDDGVDDAVDDGTQSSSSFSSWHLPLASNLQALELQSNDDTMSIASSQSFMMAYEVLENDDTASMSSFQMVANTAPSVVDPDEQQEQQQQSSVHELHQLEQEPGVADGGDEASNVADVGSNVADVGDDQQPVAKGIVQANELAKWREDQLPDASFKLLDVDQIYLTHHNGGASSINAKTIGPDAKKKMVDGKEVIKLCDDGLHRVVWEVPMAGVDGEWHCL